MNTLVHPITLTIPCAGIPPRCRNPRSYQFDRTFLFEIPEIEALPNPCLQVKTSTKEKLYYFVEGSLYTQAKTTREELLSRKYKTAEKNPELPENVEVVTTETHLRILQVTNSLEEYLLVQNSNIVLKKDIEPAYHIHRNLHRDFIGVGEAISGETYIYRADQWEEAKAECPEDEKETPPITVFDPACLQSPKNPGEISVPPKGEAPQTIFEKLQNIVNYHKAFQKQDDSIRTWSPPTIQTGLWKPMLANQNQEEILVLLVEVDEAGKILNPGQQQIIFHQAQRFTFTQEWKDQLYHLKRFTETTNPRPKEEDWEKIFQERPAPKNPDEEKIRRVLQRTESRENPNPQNATAQEEFETTTP